MKGVQQKPEESFSTWGMFLIVGIVLALALFSFYAIHNQETHWEEVSEKFCKNLSAQFMGAHGEYITCGIYNPEYGVYDTKDFRINKTRISELYDK